jgi:hypothetical protein
MGEEVKKIYLYICLPVPLYSLFGDLRMAAVTRTAEGKKIIYPTIWVCF